MCWEESGLLAWKPFRRNISTKLMKNWQARAENMVFYGVDHLKTQVLSALDPNQSILTPDYFCKGKMRLRNTIHFENEGTGAANRVLVQVEINEKFSRDKVIFLDHSLGDATDLGFKDNTNIYEVLLTRLYLAGVNEKNGKKLW